MSSNEDLLKQLLAEKDLRIKEKDDIIDNLKKKNNALANMCEDYYSKYAELLIDYNTLKSILKKK